MTKKAHVLNAQEEFVLKAIISLQGSNKDGSKGIHTVFSGFNQAFRDEFNADPVATVVAMEKAGIIDGRPAKKGHRIYLKGDMPISRKDTTTLRASIKSASLGTVSNKVADPKATSDVSKLIAALAKQYGVKL